MRRGLAMSWHGLSFLLAAVLYFAFVLPRWWEMMGDVSHGLGTAMRIVTGAIIGLTALPAVFTLIRTRRPEFGTPQLALSLRVWSIVAHVVAAVLIVGTAIAEIWLNLDTYGQWLFGVYGGAAAIAVLGALAFYLAFAAELPPPPPKPLKAKKDSKKDLQKDLQKDEASREKASTHVGDSTVDDTAAADSTQPSDTEVTESPADETVDAIEADSDEKSPAGLRNRRPLGKSRAVNANRRRGSAGSGTVAVSDD
ncbi:hypothetical protein [Mycolicibacterium komossense]|uniref:Transmembrane protein n=1 Tax=Mycolicibacterium komossense TaxID=1779 RepID=A0ABT3C944_9MYCO|nr:hypothetical protein [Mycolicibacterium komossense]MCV7225941.1 hypothetical protein [Mycolicibacterium komossense]